jgi:uncharacterized iron-regulated membrane protein
MTIAVLLLAAFLAIVVVGGTLVALFDTVEHVWYRHAAPPATAARPRPVRTVAPVVACRHLH